MPTMGAYYYGNNSGALRAKKLAARKRMKWEAMKAAMIAKRS